MKTKLIAYCASLLITASACVHAGEPAKEQKCSPEFAKMKELVGTWKGTADIGQGPVDMTVQYRMIAGGSVLEERIFPGTPHEMVTMWYEKDGKLSMTHYCVLGNRPAMALKSSEGKSMTFDFDPSCGIDPSKENHMHALTITFEDKDTITTKCKAVMEGKENEAHGVTLKRVKSAT